MAVTTFDEARLSEAYSNLFIVAPKVERRVTTPSRAKSSAARVFLYEPLISSRTASIPIFVKSLRSSPIGLPPTPISIFPISAPVVSAVAKSALLKLVSTTLEPTCLMDARLSPLWVIRLTKPPIEPVLRISLCVRVTVLVPSSNSKLPL